MKIVIAPDSFKGNLTSLQVARAMEKGIRRVLPKAKCIKVPMADGGEGTVQSLINAMGGRYVYKKVCGPDGSMVRARYGILADQKNSCYRNGTGYNDVAFCYTRMQSIHIDISNALEHATSGERFNFLAM